MHRFTIKAQNPQGQVSSYLFPSLGELRCVFLWEIFWKVFGSGQSDVHALRNLDDYVLRSEREHGLRESGLLILNDKTWIFPRDPHQIVYRSMFGIIQLDDRILSVCVLHATRSHRDS